jgi:hypothetical protein
MVKARVVDKSGPKSKAADSAQAQDKPLVM